MLNQLERSSIITDTSHRMSRALYGEVDSRQREELSYQIMLSIFIDFIIYVIPGTVMSTHVNLYAHCGVPLINWLTGLLCIICFSNL